MGTHAEQTCLLPCFARPQLLTTCHGGLQWSKEAGISSGTAAGAGAAAVRRQSAAEAHGFSM